MKTRLGGAKGAPATSFWLGRSRPPGRESSGLLPEPLAPTMETYSSRPMESETPRRTWLGLSAVPRTRWTFCARRSGPAAPASPAISERYSRSVGATDHLDRVVLGGPSRRVDRG